MFDTEDLFIAKSVPAKLTLTTVIVIRIESKRGGVPDQLQGMTSSQRRKELAAAAQTLLTRGISFVPRLDSFNGEFMERMQTFCQFRVHTSRSHRDQVVSAPHAQELEPLCTAAGTSLLAAPGA